MKTTLIIIVIALIGCSCTQRIDDLEGRVSALENPVECYTDPPPEGTVGITIHPYNTPTPIFTWDPDNATGIVDIVPTPTPTYRRYGTPFQLPDGRTGVYLPNIPPPPDGIVWWTETHCPVYHIEHADKKN